MPPVSCGTSSAYLSILFVLFGPSHQVTPFWDFRMFFYPHTSPSATRPTFPFSVLRPSISIFAKSHLPYLNSAKVVSNDSENGLLYNFTLANDLQFSHNLQISQFKSIMYKYYVDALEHNYDPKDP